MRIIIVMVSSPHPLRITTPRLELVATTSATAAAELHDHSTLAELLGAEVRDWPPPLHDADSMGYTIRFLEEHPDAVGWASWYILRREETDGRLRLVGLAGMKGEPTSDGMIEIGYGLVPEFQGRGYATEAVSGLVAWAFAHPDVTRVTAETYPHLLASIRVLEKNGFSLIGRGSEEGTIRFELARRA